MSPIPSWGLFGNVCLFICFPSRSYFYIHKLIYNNFSHARLQITTYHRFVIYFATHYSQMVMIVIVYDVNGPHTAFDCIMILLLFTWPVY